jgi:hypothetical protein
VYRTTDFGASWDRLVDEKDVWGYALSFIQDPVVPALMFTGTEFGLYVSIDGGKEWTKWKANYPTVSTMDLAIQSREADLIVGTFGRAIYVLDDLRPLREIARTGIQVLAKPVHLFDIPDASLTRFKWTVGGGFGSGDGEYFGDNRPYGARLTFVITPPDTSKQKDAKLEKKKAEPPSGSPDSATFDVFTAKGELIRTFKRSVKKGINRTTWSLDRRVERGPSQPKPEPGAPEPGGWDVMPGKYLIRITYLAERDSATVSVSPDNRLAFTEAEMHANTLFLDTVYSRIRAATGAADRLRDAKKTVEQIAGIIKDRSDSSAAKVREAGTAMQDSIKNLIELINDKEVQGIRSDPAVLENKLGMASGYAGSSWYPPGSTERIALQQAVESLKTIAAKINVFFERDWLKYKNAVDAAKITFFERYTPITVDQ